MDLNNNESINNQIENLIQNEFNSTNYDANVNYSLNQLTQFINSNTQDCLLNSNLNETNTAIENNTNSFLTTSVVASCQNDLDHNEIYSNDNFEKAFEAASNMMDDIKNRQTNLDNNIESEPFSFSFLSDDVLSTSLSPSQPSTVKSTTNNNKEHISDKTKLNRFNYKCKYCTSYSTKFKAHILEHMQLTHNIYLIECPDKKCLKRFKDEWKLKRHLMSNVDHQMMNQFKNLNDIMKPHVEVTPQRFGFACPLCQFDSNQNVLITNDIENINIKKLDNNLYFDKYDDLKEHITTKHANLDMNYYFICKDCGQVFQNKYKLKCHSFNVHSGKRKNRKKTTKTIESKSVDSIMKSHIKDSIDSVLVRYEESQAYLRQQQLKQELELQQQQLKISCITCNKKFKRIRDINIHIKIMHKKLTDSEKQQQEHLFNEHKRLKKVFSLNKNRTILTNIKSQMNKKIESKKLENKNIKVCFVCNKVFKQNPSNTASTTILDKAFIRHMQIQHGMNEKGERLLDCPVCEKSFFNRQQMERHMHTHEVWINIKQDDQNNTDYLNQYNNANNNSLKTNDAPDFRDKHSILYCHECVECNIYFKSIKVLTRHKRDMHCLKPVYKCANTLECNLEFEAVACFLEHSKIHPQRNIICSRCKSKFENKNALRHHMKNVHYNRKISTTRIKKTSNTNQSQTIRSLATKSVNNNSINATTTSTFAFNTLNQENTNKESNVNNSLFISNAPTIQPLNDKTLTNENIMNETFCCPTCKKYFSSRNALHNHLATHNTNELRLFLCNVCGHSFKTRKDLSRHASLHDASKHKTCPECGMTFKTSFHLKRHSLTRHSDFRPFKCNHCEMTFARKDKLKQHEAKHINHPLYQCSQCTKGFYRKEHLKDHEISKHSKQYPFSCEHCNKGFVHAKDLHRHIRVRHLGLTPNQNSTTTKQLTNTNLTNITNSSINLIQLATKQTKTKTNNLNKISYPLSMTSSQTTTVPLSSNDFKSKKISSILKSNLVSSKQEHNIGQSVTNNNSNAISSHQLVIEQPNHIPVLQQTIPILTTGSRQIIQQQQQQSTQQFNILINSNDNKSFLILNNDFQSINILNDKPNQPKLNITPTSTTTAQTNPINKSMNKTNTSNQQQYLKSFKCNTCSKDFFYENHLRKHILSKHTKTPLFACSFCNQGFSTKSTAKSHVENSHVSYTCPVCNKSFKTKSHCVRHITCYHNTVVNVENLNPKRVEVDAKIVDFSSTNMNMLNLISIDDNNTNNNNNNNNITIIKPKSPEITTNNNLKNLTNSSNFIVYNQSNQLIPIATRDLRDVFAQPNQSINTFFAHHSLYDPTKLNFNQ